MALKNGIDTIKLEELEKRLINSDITTRKDMSTAKALGWMAEYLPQALTESGLATGVEGYKQAQPFILRALIEMGPEIAALAAKFAKDALGNKL